MRHYHVVNFQPRESAMTGIPNEVYATFITVEPADTMARNLVENHATERPCNLAVIECDCPHCARASTFADFGSLLIQ